MSTVLTRPRSSTRARSVHRQPQLRALVRLAQRIARRTAGEAALRADRQPLEADVLRRFVGAASQAIHAFKHGRLAADEPEHDALPLGHEAQRRKVARPRRVVFEQEVVRVGAREEALRDRLVSAIGEMAAPEVAAAHMMPTTTSSGQAAIAPLMASI